MSPNLGYSQHFVHYYSIPCIISVLILSPDLLPLALFLHILPGVVDYVLKRPPMLSLLSFLFYHFLENIFYQIGVYSGCFNKKTWRPLIMEFVSSDIAATQVFLTVQSLSHFHLLTLVHKLYGI